MDKALWFIAGLGSGIIVMAIMTRTYGNLPVSLLVSLSFATMIIVTSIAGVITGFAEVFEKPKKT